MSIFSYHIVQLPFLSAIKAILSPLKAEKIHGLIHAETMSVMTLGSHILSLSRFFNRKIVVFAQWKNEQVLQQFIDTHPFGKQLNQGWHVRLTFIRQWGSISGYHIPKTIEEKISDELPVVAVTIARMRYLEIPRFLQWGRPVEKLVRDHSGTTLSLASVRYPNTISTFSIWKTQKEMTDMVHGHSQMPQPKRHIDAMKERNRKDFHFEFTTLRFLPISEHGTWENNTSYIPNPSTL